MSDIAINPVTRRVQFTGNTGTGPFAFTFNVLNSSDIAVYKNTTLLTLTADYTVTIAANGTGSVTLQAGQAVVAADYVTIIGGRDLERTTDFVTAGDLLASSLNEQLDSNVIMSQQLDESFGRSISSSPGDVDVSMTLPTASSRANQVLAFTSTGAVTTTNLNDLPELTVDKLNVDNLTLDGNTISTTNSNGNLILTPNGTGDVVVSGDLVVNGTTTTIHSTVVDIADKNITIAYGSSDAAAANGAGITVDGADATMNYYSTPDGWEFNKAVTVGYTGSTPQDLGGVLNVYSSSSSVPGMVIKSSSTSVDPKIQFEYSSQIWTVGQDSSSDDFKIINGTNLNSSAEIHINTDGDVALGGVSHYSDYELSVPQRVAIRSGSAVAGIDFAGTTELLFDGNVGGTNGSFAKFRFASNESTKMEIDGTTLKAHAFASVSGTGVSVTDDLKFGDDKKTVFGDSTDLSVYFDASANKSYISHTGSGSFPVLEFNTDGYDMRFLGGGYFMIRATPGADVKLYHAGSTKLTTSSSGVVITGSITADSFGGVLSIADGSSSAPSLTNTGNTNTGLFFPANNQVGISASASEIVNISTLGVKITPFSGTDALVLNNNDTSIGDNNAIARIIATADDPTADQEGAEILFLSAGAWSTDSYPTEIILRTDNGGSLTNRMVVGSTGIDVTGTVTADGLTVDGEGVISSTTTVTDLSNPILQLTGSSYTANGVYGIGFNYNIDGSGTSPVFAGYQLTSGSGNTKGNLVFGTRDTTSAGDVPLIRQKIASNGDINFYATDGTTQAFHWDAADERLGIGTTSPTALIDISKSGTADYSTFRLSNTGASGRKYEIGLGGNAAASDYANKLYFRDSTAGANRITLDSSGNLGIGTSSPDTPLHIETSGNTGIKLKSSTAGTGYINFNDGVTAKGQLLYDHNGDYMRFYVNGAERLRIETDGDIQFGTSTNYAWMRPYETTTGNLIISADNGGTGTNGSNILFRTRGANKMIIEHSTGNVGIGTSSPSSYDGEADNLVVASSVHTGITIASTGTNQRTNLYFADGTFGSNAYIGGFSYDHSNDNLLTRTGGAERMRIDSSGNVGIGITPESWVTGYGGRVLQIGDAAVFGGSTNDSMSYMLANAYYDSVNSRWEYINTDFATRYEQLDGEHIFYTAASGTADAAITWSQAMRLDASGRLLVGKTSSDYATEGVEIRDNEVLITKAGANPLSVRNNGAGGLISFNSAGSAVGDIGASGANMIMGTGATGIYFNNASQSVHPWNISANQARNGAIDLGRDTDQFRNIYINGGVVFDAVAGNATSNTLDDYEEGTWTISDGSGAGLSFTVQDNVYTKTGRLVVASAIITWPSTANTSTARIVLPFTSIANNSHSGGVVTEQNWNTSITLTAACNYTNGVVFRQRGGSSLTNANLSGKKLRFTITYHAA